MDLLSCVLGVVLLKYYTLDTFTTIYNNGGVAGMDSNLKKAYYRLNTKNSEFREYLKFGWCLSNMLEVGENYRRLFCDSVKLLERFKHTVGIVRDVDSDTESACFSCKGNLITLAITRMKQEVFVCIGLHSESIRISESSHSDLQRIFSISPDIGKEIDGQALFIFASTYLSELVYVLDTALESPHLLAKKGVKYIGYSNIDI